jgi:hypothetical protein
MPTKTRTKFISDVAHADVAVKVAKPFKVEKEEQRQFIRLEISSPMDLRKIKDIAGNFWPTGERRMIEGLILNISAGGVLVEVNHPVNEGDVVAMHFTLQDVESLDNILGLVKRSERDEGSFLVGIEFISREYLVDLFSEGELDLLSDKMCGFNDQVRTVLNKYIRKEKLSEGR